MSIQPPDNERALITVARKWPHLRNSCTLAAVTVYENFIGRSRPEPVVVRWQPWGRGDCSGMKVAAISSLQNRIRANLYNKWRIPMSKLNPRLSVTVLNRAFYWLVLAVIFSLSLTILPNTISAQPLPPGLVELEGTLEVLHEDRDPGSRYVYFLRTAIERLELRFTADAPALQTGDHVRARGRRSNGVLALDSSASVQTLAAALPNTFGAQKTLVILVKFTESDPAPDKPYSVSTAQNVFNTTSNFDLENSYTQTWMTGVTNTTAAADIVGWFTLNQSSSVCDYSTTANLADQAATAAGVNLSQYTRKVYAFPQNSCTWWGLGTVGGNPSRSWINGSLQLRVVAHEMGHNLGLYHSHSLDCGAAVIGGTCTSSDYGDYFDTMGSSAYHYNAYQKERLGWLNYNVSPPITTVTTDGTYWIAPYETDTDEPKALKVLQSIDSSGRRTNYYLEFRRPIGFDAGMASNSNVMNGVLVHLGTESSGNTIYLLDMTPATSSWTDPALTVGQSYSDSTAGVTFTVLSADATGANVSMTFSGGGGTTCTRANPTVSLSPSSQSTTVGSSVSYTTSVTNNDSSGCTASGFSLGAAMPSGLTASFGSSSLSIAPGSSASANLTVSSSSSLSSGTYSFTATGTNSTSTSYSGSALGVDTLMAPASIGVSVSTDKSSYSRNQSVTMTATVTSSGAPVAGASVSFTITKANGSLVTGSATTGSGGTAIYKYRVKQKDPLGTYQVNAAANMSGVLASATTTFTVQ